MGEKTLAGDRKSYSTSKVYKVIAREDPQKAWEQLKGEPGHLRGKIFGGILEIVADEDPTQAMSMLMSLENKSEQRIATGNFLGNLNWDDTRLASQLIDQVKDPATRRESLGDQMYYAAWGTPDLLKAQVAKMTDRARAERVDRLGSRRCGRIVPRTSRDPAQHRDPLANAGPVF